MCGNSVFTEDMDHKKLGEFGSHDVVRGRNEDSLFRESINNYEECSVARRVGKIFYEVHGNGVPRLLGHRELLQKSVRFMMRGFGSFASGARVTELLAWTKVQRLGQT